MEPESSPPRITPEQDPEHEVRVDEDLVDRLFSQITETASGFLDFSRQMKEYKETMEETVRKLTLEMEEKEKVLELQTKEAVSQLKNSMARKHAKLKREFQVREEKLEAREEEVRLVYGTITEKSSELEKREDDVEAKRKSLELKEKRLEEGMNELDVRQKELRLLDETIKEKATELEKREQKQEAESREIEAKRKSLDLKEKRLEEMMNELDVKQKELRLFYETIKEKTTELEKREQKQEAESREIEGKRKSLEFKEKELEERSKQAENRKRSRDEYETTLFAEHQNIDDEADEDPEPYNCLDADFNSFNNTMSFNNTNEHGNTMDIPDPEFNVFEDDASVDKTDTDECNKRKFSKRKPQASYAERIDNDDSEIPPTKKTKPSCEFESDFNTKQTDKDNMSPELADKGKANKDSEGCDRSGEDAALSSKMGEVENGYNANENGNTLDIPDPEFNVFENERRPENFAVNQVWSTCDFRDGMPRRYARVKKLLAVDVKLLITYLKPVQEKNDESIPVAWGKFKNGESSVVDCSMFSAQMLHLFINRVVCIYPRKGEIWAMFRDWDEDSNTPENHKSPYQYDFVEIVKEFKEKLGIRVAYLGKVKGFVSLFQREAKNTVAQIQFSPKQMLRLSHKVPAVKMTGMEKDSVPAGSYELDPTALPKDIFQVDEVDMEMNSETMKEKADGPYPEAPEIGMKAKPVPEICGFNFKNERSADKFRVCQIWAIYSNEKGMPTEYVKIRKVEIKPELVLHAVHMELCPSSTEPVTCSVSCGEFKMGTGKPKILPLTSFSHRVNPFDGKKKIVKVYPRKGEIWALCKKCDSTEEEHDIVEVVEGYCEGKSIKAMALTAKGFSSVYMRKHTGSLEISKAEMSRFSHQIPAVKQEFDPAATRLAEGGYWELDPAAIPPPP